MEPEADRRRNPLILLTPEGARRPLCKPFSRPQPLLKRIAARLTGFDGAYHRFTGKVTIEKFERSLRVERFDDRAI